MEDLAFLGGQRFYDALREELGGDSPRSEPRAPTRYRSRLPKAQCAESQILRRLQPFQSGSICARTAVALQDVQRNIQLLKGRKVYSLARSHRSFSNSSMLNFACFRICDSVERLSGRCAGTVSLRTSAEVRFCRRTWLPFCLTTTHPFRCNARITWS